MNYVPYHVHSDISNATTTVDSVTKFKDYIAAAKECGMEAFGFSEHGNIFEWYFKKLEIEKSGMKYLHCCEVYITMHETGDKVRDNYHCVLIARNRDGFEELNRLVSSSFNRKDNHFFYTPRIFMSELEATSDDILVTTACVGGVLASQNESDKERFLRFIKANKSRCFLEIQHHMDFRQMEHNQYLYDLSKRYNIPLIAGTDTHALNEEHLLGRKMLQLAKDIHFPDETEWDMSFKTYDSLCEAYRKQNCLPENVYLEAIENTNLLASIVEPISIDTSNKYPNIYDNPNETFRKVVYEAAESHPYAISRHGREKLFARIEEELAVYEKVGATPYMLLKKYLTDWEREHGIFIGPGRGSVSGSMIAYLLHITEMDSMKFDLNFFRFLNPDRISLADIDSDYISYDRDKVKSFMLDDHLNLHGINTAEIITFNTIATRGSIIDMAKAMNKLEGIEIFSQSDIRRICDSVDENGQITDSMIVDRPELVKYVNIVSGTITSIGSHPCGVLISDHDLASEVGLCTTSGSKYPVSCLYMSELDAQNFVKWDLLGLDNIRLINETCSLANIQRLTPDNTPLDDAETWDAIRNDTTCIFQWESDQASAFLRKMFSKTTLANARSRDADFSLIKWMSFGNGLIRPACASYRDDVAAGNSYDNGVPALNTFLSKEAGHICMQETIMKFLVQFCGYSQSESDTVRRGIAKKKGTDKLLPEIESRFISYAPQHYDITPEKASEVIKPFLQTIMDASAYAFSWNHSDAYSCIGYICGYLRTHYPLEFITSALNTFADNQEKTANIINYAQTHNIHIYPPRYGKSGADYTLNREENNVYKGIASIKYMNRDVAEELLNLSSSPSDSFISVLLQIANQTHLDSRQLEILIKLDFFIKFGNSKELMKIKACFDYFKQGSAKQIKKDLLPDRFSGCIQNYATDQGKNGELKSWIFTNLIDFMKKIESDILSEGIPDFTFKEKCDFQSQNLGYVDLCTGKPGDRRKLYIIDQRPMKSKTGNEIWAYAIATRSVGTGKCSRMTVSERVFRLQPFNPGDIINASAVHKNKNGFWYLDEYEIVEGG